MEPVELNNVIREVRGRWIGNSQPPNVRIADLATDSRTLSGQGLFVALLGTRQDGHSYVEEARQRGAVASIVSEGKVRRLPRSGGPYIAVDDPLAALERLGKWNRDSLRLSVIGITGSVGKTSTKEFLGTVLQERFHVKTAPRSFNNRLGVALTLISAGPRTEILVVELATSGPGELSHLSRLVRPQRIVLTEIAPAHLQGLGDMEGVVAAKAEVFEGLAPDGASFLPQDVYGFEQFVRLVGRPPVTFGWGGGDYAVSACERVTLGANGARESYKAYGYHFTVNDKENFLLPVPGRHNVLNAAATIAVARDLGMGWEEIRASMAQCRLPPLRLQVIEAGGVILFNDSYNASPRSMEAAIEEWLSLGDGDNGNGGTGNGDGQNGRIAVLGDMLELGKDSRRLHEEVGQRLVSARARVLVTVGSESRWIREAYEREGGSGETVHFASAQEVSPYLQHKIRGGDQVLFKGSRRVGLDQAVLELRRWLAKTDKE